MELGTKRQNICQRICFLKTAIREAELAKVPTVRENGTTDGGNSTFNMGISIKLAPPPEIALIQNDRMVPRKSKISVDIESVYNVVSLELLWAIRWLINNIYCDLFFVTDHYARAAFSINSGFKLFVGQYKVEVLLRCVSINHIMSGVATLWF